MKLKLVILFFTFLHFTFLISDTIIDSVYADPLLDGEIQFFQPTQEYVILNGDQHDATTTGDSGYENCYSRSYYSFDIPSIPEGYHIDSVYIKITEYRACGNNILYHLPIWDVPNGDTIRCIMSHIDYGDELDVSDWTHGDYNSPYTYHYDIGITITDSTDYLYFDVTDYVLDDVANQRQRSQYRIAFEIDTDWDYMSDNVTFVTSESIYSEWLPIIYFIYKENVAVKDYINKNSSVYLDIYPNPVNTMMKISYIINQPTFVSLKFYNIKGQLVETIVNENRNAGKHTAFWNAENQSSGVYMYRINAGAITGTGKCLLVK
ncbi:MAG: T9SS type A sorting domain-containing protein [Candidatus Cloacimonetes bacterium]|nr:T9SS type A sorting domain-containing protein [Candidatus Cloacimonadota bacterium]